MDASLCCLGHWSLADRTDRLGTASSAERNRRLDQMAATQPEHGRALARQDQVLAELLRRST